MTVAEGSSPLTRGAPQRRNTSLISTRLIPAHAGSTSQLPGVFGPNPAHPRSRGEHRGINCMTQMGPGSSPLTRGALMLYSYSIAAMGLIPAHAGSTAWAWDRKRPAGAHPRSRGENRNQAYIIGANWGSSPLTRGEPWFHGLVEKAKRLIPAHAGRTMKILRICDMERAHPRSRGENTC